MYEHLRALREDKDLSQKQLADLLQVHQTTYSDYERGNVNIPVPALIKLADFYKTSIDYLVDHTDDPRPCRKRKYPPPRKPRRSHIPPKPRCRSG